MQLVFKRTYTIGFNMKTNKGVSLIEMLITVLIFSLVMGTAAGIFASAIKLQRYNLKHQQLLNQVSYTAEYMSRAIRMAQKDDGTCIDGSNYLETADSIKFATYHDQCWEFFLQNGQLKINKDGTVYELSSSSFQVSDFIVNVIGDGVDNLQPKVTIYLEITGIGSGYQPKVKIQTTISQRNLDI